MNAACFLSLNATLNQRIAKVSVQFRIRRRQTNTRNTLVAAPCQHIAGAAFPCDQLTATVLFVSSSFLHLYRQINPRSRTETHTSGRAVRPPPLHREMSTPNHLFGSLIKLTQSIVSGPPPHSRLAGACRPLRNGSSLPRLQRAEPHRPAVETRQAAAPPHDNSAF